MGREVIMLNDLTELLHGMIAAYEANTVFDVGTLAEAGGTGEYLPVLLKGPPYKLINDHGRAVFGINTEYPQPF